MRNILRYKIGSACLCIIIALAIGATGCRSDKSAKKVFYCDTQFFDHLFEGLCESEWQFVRYVETDEQYGGFLAALIENQHGAQLEVWAVHDHPFEESEHIQLGGLFPSRDELDRGVPRQAIHYRIMPRRILIEYRNAT